MKKILFALVLFTVFSFTQSGRKPVIEKVYGEYLPVGCQDSIVAPAGTGVQLSIQKTVNVATVDYVLLGNDGTASFDVEFTDVNGGSIVSGDAITMTQCDYNLCGVAYHLRLTGSPVVVVSGGRVYFSYSDCILPLNGTNGKVRAEWVQ